MVDVLNAFSVEVYEDRLIDVIGNFIQNGKFKKSIINCNAIIVSRIICMK